MFGNIGLYRRELFQGILPGQRLPLRPRFESGIAEQRISAQLYQGAWFNVGTPQQLQQLNA